MPILNTGQIFSSGDQVTSQKLMDIAGLATFRTGANQTADDVTIQVDGQGGYLKVPSGGITSNELASDSVTSAKIQDGAVTAAKLDSAAVSVLMPTATILPYAGSTAPTGYLVCAGQSVLVADYGDLYGVIGFTYGGSGASFNLPDLRGRVIAGQDDMGGTSANRLTGLSGGVNGDNLGATGGSETHTLTTSEIPAHTHDFPIDGNNGSVDGTIVKSSITELNPHTQTTSSVGGDQPHNNVQPTIILNYIIKT